MNGAQVRGNLRRLLFFLWFPPLLFLGSLAREESAWNRPLRPTHTRSLVLFSHPIINQPGNGLLFQNRRIEKLDVRTDRIRCVRAATVARQLPHPPSHERVFRIMVVIVLGVVQCLQPKAGKPVAELPVQMGGMLWMVAAAAAAAAVHD